MKQPQPDQPTTNQQPAKVYRADTIAGAKEWAERWVERHNHYNDKDVERLMQQAGSPQ